MTQYEVVVAGGGPTGMMLAAELALAGIRVAVVERRESYEFEGTRARGLHARTIEILDQRGVADRFLDAGYTAQVQSFAGVTLSIEDFPTRHPYGLALVQQEFERILGGWVAELGVPVLRRREVAGFADNGSGVQIALDDGTALAAAFLVGCDGGRSLVRSGAGIEFPGWEPSISSIIGEVALRDEPPLGIRRDVHGQHAMAPAPGGLVGVVVSEPYTGQNGQPTLTDLRRALVAVWGTDFGAHSPRWLSRFTDATRQAAAYRSGRVLLAGDAAHVHYPVGGQGLNLGVHDAVNLGWKLAQVVQGRSPESLLDSYHAERHPVGEQVLRLTMAQTVLTRSEPRLDALRDTVAGVVGLDEARRRIAGAISGLDVAYDLGDGHPLMGRRVPDLDVVTAAGPATVYSLLHAARPVLLNLGRPGSVHLGAWTDRVRLVEASCPGPWELPVLGAVPAPGALLVRPDGHVAWVGDGDDAGLVDALGRWFGDTTPRAR